MEIIKYLVKKNKKINLAVPIVTGSELKYLKNCVDTGWLSTAGPLITKFEKKICSITKSKYAVACMNGTSALHISLLLAGVKKNHEVIVPTLTFIAPINAVKYCNAEPIFMDCDYKFNLDIEKTLEFINKNTFQKNGYCINQKTNKKISALILVHVWGNPVDFFKLIKVCKSKNIKIIEDASESFGSFALLKNKKKHTGTMGFLGCFSFNGNKIITSGGGGAIITNNKNIQKKARYLTQQAKNSKIEFVHNEIGYNYRMTNIQAAIGLGQLEHFSKILNKKKYIYNSYSKIFYNNKKFKILEHDKYSNCWMNLLIFKSVKKPNILKYCKYLSSKGVEARPVWKPNHLQKQFLKCQKYKLVKSIDLYNKSLCLPSSTEIDNLDIKKIFSFLD